MVNFGKNNQRKKLSWGEAEGKRNQKLAVIFYKRHFGRQPEQEINVNIDVVVIQKLAKLKSIIINKPIPWTQQFIVGD